MLYAHPPRAEGDIVSVVDAYLAADGTAAHPYVRSLIAAAQAGSAHPLADLADAAHYLCLLHGRHPGVVDHAALHSADNAARRWLLQACDGFADERAYMTQVSVALGPVPSTAGQASADSAILQQRHALDMLAQSDRRGCAIGAAITLVQDWVGVRLLLDRAALRVGIEPPRCTLPQPADTAAVLDAIAADSSSARAIQFGARQLLAQHHGLWELLRARADMRTAV